MDERALSVWRLTWPKAIPEHDYETALMLAGLIATAGRKPEVTASKATAMVVGAMDGGEMLGAIAAAKLIGRSAQSIRDWHRAGKITGHRTPKGMRFRRADVLNLKSGPRLVMESQPEQLSLPEGESALTVLQAAKATNLGFSAIAGACKRGELKHTKGSAKSGPGAARRILPADLAEWMESRMAAGT